MGHLGLNNRLLVIDFLKEGHRERDVTFCSQRGISSELKGMLGT
jgi:hypothetical protein